MILQTYLRANNGEQADQRYITIASAHRHGPVPHDIVEGVKNILILYNKSNL